MADTIDSARASGKQDVAQAQGIQTVEGAALIARAILPIAPSGSSVVTAIQRLARAHVIPEALLAALDEPLGGAIATAAEYAGSALSEATKRAYARDWFHFADWCRQQAVDPAWLPIHPVLVAAYLASLAGTLGRSALNGRLAAIAHEHRRRGLAWNAGHPAIRETLQGVGRKHGRPVRPAAALTSVEIKQFLAIRRNDLAGLRDRALFLIGFAGALRRSELVAIDHPQLRFEAGSVTIHIPGPNATKRAGVPT